MRHLTVMALLCLLPRISMEAGVNLEVKHILKPVYKTFAPSISAIDLYFAAKTVYSEAGIEDRTGKMFTCQTIVNRANKYGISVAHSCFKGFVGVTTDLFDETPSDELINLCRQVLQSEPIHNYTYFVNFNLPAKDTSFMEYAKTRKGVTVGRQFYFSDKKR